MRRVVRAAVISRPSGWLAWRVQPDNDDWDEPDDDNKGMTRMRRL
jgi:hypothetical protein